MDIVVQLNTPQLEQGLIIQDKRKLAVRYMHTRHFALDLLTLVPLDLIQCLVGIQPMLRFPRRRGSSVGEINTFENLPDKLKVELALDVNLETLKKVIIFKDCRPELLHDLVLKMRSSIVTPGDYICRKDEIARDLFIVADGVLEVVG
ncbi:hypothetical protein P879_01866 [Paragonimus westermani]|uniref:Cyclic nucleotide-binding domain-containing protein n=1 Tax=Paragonimus westermani TaxID=34504 RepID=A0A8T0DTS2_9TREM|nr:hypothetical protein P879_01866 [Paragonimus westermani]